MYVYINNILFRKINDYSGNHLYWDHLQASRRGQDKRFVDRSVMNSHNFAHTYFHGDRRETGGSQEGARRETGGRQEGDRREPVPRPRALIAAVGARTFKAQQFRERVSNPRVAACLDLKSPLKVQSPESGASFHLSLSLSLSPSLSLSLSLSLSPLFLDDATIHPPTRTYRVTCPSAQRQSPTCTLACHTRAQSNNQQPRKGPGYGGCFLKAQTGHEHTSRDMRVAGRMRL